MWKQLVPCTLFSSSTSTSYKINGEAVTEQAHAEHCLMLHRCVVRRRAFAAHAPSSKQTPVWPLQTPTESLSLVSIVRCFFIKLQLQGPV